MWSALFPWLLNLVVERDDVTKRNGTNETNWIRRLRVQCAICWDAFANTIALIGHLRTIQYCSGLTSFSRRHFIPATFIIHHTILSLHAQNSPLNFPQLFYFSDYFSFSFYIILQLLIFIFIISFQLFSHPEFQFLFSSEKTSLFLHSFSSNSVRRRPYLANFTVA